MPRHKIRLSQIAVEQEASPGTAETLVAADALVRANDMAIEIDVPVEYLEYARNTFSQDTFVPGKKMGTFTFNVPCSGTGSAGVEITEISDLHQGCGLNETVNTGTDVTFTLGDPYTYEKPVTMAGYEAYDGTNAMIYKIEGAMGNVKLVAPPPPAVINWAYEFKGRLKSSTTGALLDPTPASTAPTTFKSATLTSDGDAMGVETLEIDLGNDIVLPDDPSHETGYGVAEIVNRRVVGSMDPYMEEAGVHDFYGKQQAGTANAFSFIVGSSGGTRLTVAASALRYTDVKPGERNGLRTAQVTLAFDRSSADDDEISFKFD